MRSFVGILLLLCACIQAGEARTGKRVIAWAHHTLIRGFPLTMADSTVFMYSGNRGSTFDYMWHRYCFSEYKYPGGWGNLFDYQYQLGGEIGVERMWVQSDSNIIYYYSPGDKRIHRRASYVYDYAADGSLLSLGQSTVAGKYDWQMVAAYDAAGVCSRMYYINRSNPLPDTISVRYLFHNASGQLERDSTFTEEPFSGRTADDVGYFTYTGTRCTKQQRKVWDGSAYRPDLEALFTYYPGGKAKTILYWSTTVGSPTTMLYAAKDSFGYTPGMQVPSFYQTWGLFNNLSSPASGFNVDRFNAAGYPDSVTMYHSTGDSLYPNVGRRLYYDADNNPLRIDYTMLHPTAPYIALRDLFYYESYETGVPAVPAPVEMMIIPNPAGGPVSLHFSSGMANMRVHISVTNMAGLAVHRESAVLNGARYDLVLGSEAPPGLYHITVQNAAGHTVSTGRLVRQ